MSNARILEMASQPEHADSLENPVKAHVDTWIVFFDGVCGVCNAAVDFMLPRDRDAVLMFAPLQGDTARTLLPTDDVTTLASMVLYRNGQTWRKSAAMVRMLRLLGGKWSVAATLLWLIPGPVRDLGYRMFAAVRYRLFGRHATCRLPSPAERARFLP